MIYKLVLDMLERYYHDLDTPTCKTLRLEFIPFAIRFYQELSQEEMELINQHVDYFKGSYSSKIESLRLIRALNEGKY